MKFIDEKPDPFMINADYAKSYKLTVSITATETVAADLKEFCRSLIDPFWPYRLITYAESDETERFYTFDFIINDKEAALEAIEICKNHYPSARFLLSGNQ